MGTKYVVVIGASAGGIETLRELVSKLPAEFPAPLCVVVHTAPESPGVLGDILSRAGILPAENARDRERLQPGRIYVAPPDFHLLLEPGRVRLTKGPKENRFRPAIDPLFRSAAQVYGPAAIGVVLTGYLDDGTAGLWALKQLGGTAIVQSPEDALFPAMPRNALAHVKVDHKVRLVELAPLLVRLTSSEDVKVATEAPPRALEVEVNIAKEQNALEAGVQEIAEPSSFACPECHGVLLQIKEGGRIRFRCHTGHAYSPESLVAAVNEGIEEALWNAVRAVEEGQMLMRSLAEHVGRHNEAHAEAVLSQAHAAKAQAETIRKLVMEREAIAAKS